MVSLKVHLVLLAALLGMALADVYLHNPRGQNDRCDEKSNDRTDETRMWNSDDNTAGGYSWCDKEMTFYTGSELDIMWYTQHSCGNGQMNKEDVNNPESTICAHVLQLGCEDKFQQFAGKEHDTYKLTDGISLGRPGADNPNELAADPLSVYDTFGSTCTDRMPTWADCPNSPDQDPNNDECNNLDLSDATQRGTFNSETCECSARKWKTYGYHEPQHWWQMCNARDRNGGLFTADQRPQNGKATNTRQEPNSDRYGFECPEERDYWPYWHPTPWIDLAVYVSNTTLCKYYQKESQNVKDKCMCTLSGSTTDYDQQDTQDAYTAYQYNQQSLCEGAGYKWVCWGNWHLSAPKCSMAPGQVDNRLGNPNDRGSDAPDEYKGDEMATHKWKIDDDIIPDGQNSVRCTIRLRYNISTLETPFDFDYTNNGAIKEDPVVTYGDAYFGPTDSRTGKPGRGIDHLPVRLAIDTAQFGRTFQDRTYVFNVSKPPSNLKHKTIRNVNVRGKRGNIAQVRNCLEYDFVPNLLKAAVGDYIHFQWCGSDYNNDGNAGEGRDGTDRSNVVAVPCYQRNLPQSLNATTYIFDEDDLRDLAWLNQTDDYCYSVYDMLYTQQNQGNDPLSCHFLNGVRDPDNPSMPTAYYSKLVEVKRGGTFYYMNSRNNNFTNRSQKGLITTDGMLSMAAKVGIGIGVSLGVILLVGGGIFGYMVYTGRVHIKRFSSRV